MKNFTLLFLAILSFSNPVIAQEWDWMFATQSVPDTQFGSYAYPMATICDPQGNVYMNCISTHPGITFGNQTFNGSNGVGRNFLISFNNAGTIQWIKATDATDLINTIAIASDAAGNIYSAGEFTIGYNDEGYIFDNDQAALNTFISKRDNNGNIQWVKHISVEGNPENTDEYINRIIRPYDIVTDVSGNVFICGQMRGTNGVFGNITVPILGEVDTFVAKYDSNGNVLWVKTVVEHGYQGQRRLVCDSAGNVYMAGSHSGDFTIAFDETVLGGGTSLTYVVKYSPEGDMLWLQSHGGSTTEDIFCYNIAIDANDNIYTAGYLNYTSINFGDVVLNTGNSTQYHGFATKYNSNGVALWAKSSGANDAVKDIQTGNDGSVYLLGNFWSPQIVFGNTTLVNEGTANGYIVKMDADGNYLWAEQIGGSGHSESYLAVDNSNNSIYVSGNYNNARFGSQTYTATTPGELFLAKYNPTSLGIPDFNITQQRLYPNPAMDRLTITGIQDAPFSIIDMTGRLVAQGQMSTNFINVSALPPGMYLLNINNTITKFIKE